MPNWCENYVTFEGDSDNIKRLKEDIESSVNDRLYETLIGKHPEWVEDNWYRLNCIWFGSKWDIVISDMSIHYQEFLETPGASLILNFGSAWSPTCEGTQRVCEKYKVSAEHYYEEPGENFSGRLDILEDGSIENDLQYDDVGLGIYEMKGSESWFNWFEHQAEYFDEEWSIISKKDWVDSFGYITNSEREEALEYLNNLKQEEL